MGATGWRHEGNVGTAVFNLLIEGVTPGELMHVARELGIQKRAEPTNVLGYLRACIKRHREPRLVLPPAPAAKPAARTDAAWLAYRRELQSKFNEGCRPGDDEWPAEPPLPVEGAA